ncbi:MarR family winged helix-turn-helix transcriptional regulator [Desulfitobacterium sp.]|uniref:MarR family winged helix-turn-helix transcriptional regulator n=1 Tax=Desulfitobacterium sp. TaxID=49981 RepID=UPI002C1D1CA3|nr:MarR family transcriptional regulator [Desulfitobacterium sp.]HVJ49272.1 MarR family transcriptional regulator [Desulfitobacterium sp.]
MEIGNAEKIYQIMQKFQKMRMNSTNTSEMPRSEIKMLNMIKLNTSETEEVTISILSELLEISKPAVSQMINVLEDKGYVERMTTKNDRRIVYVRLTECGEQRLVKELQAVRISLLFITFQQKSKRGKR